MCVRVCVKLTLAPVHRVEQIINPPRRSIVLIREFSLDGPG